MNEADSSPVSDTGGSVRSCASCAHAEYTTPVNPARLARCIEYGKTVRLTRTLKCVRWEARSR